MAKLNNKEIQDNINMEMGDNPLPRDAHSKFRFEIEESVDDLVRDMKERLLISEIRNIRIFMEIIYCKIRSMIIVMRL